MQMSCKNEHLKFCRERMRQIAEELNLPEKEKEQIDNLFKETKKD